MQFCTKGLPLDAHIKLRMETIEKIIDDYIFKHKISINDLKLNGNIECSKNKITHGVGTYREETYSYREDIMTQAFTIATTKDIVTIILRRMK